MDQYINYGNGVIKTINIVPEGKYITYNISIVSDVKDHKCISYSFVTENIFEYIKVGVRLVFSYFIIDKSIIIDKIIEYNSSGKILHRAMSPLDGIIDGELIYRDDIPMSPISSSELTRSCSVKSDDVYYLFQKRSSSTDTPDGFGNLTRFITEEDYGSPLIKTKEYRSIATTPS